MTTKQEIQKINTDTEKIKAITESIKSESYQNMKIRHSKEVNGFKDIFYAFNTDQFKEGMASLNLDSTKPEDLKKIVSIGSGGYVLKNKLDELDSILKRHQQERRDLKKNNKLLLEALTYELINHEYIITYDLEPALNALNLKKEDIDPVILNKARKAAIDNCC